MKSLLLDGDIRAAFADSTADECVFTVLISVEAHQKLRCSDEWNDWTAKDRYQANGTLIIALKHNSLNGKTVQQTRESSQRMVQAIDTPDVNILANFYI